MWIVDKVKMDVGQIEKKPGTLPAKIIMDNLVKSKYKVWVLSNLEGSTLFSLALSTGDFATPVWTDFNLLKSYSNRELSRKKIFKHLGNGYSAIHTSLFLLQNVFNPINYPPTQTLLINPNSRDYFIPLSLLQIQSNFNKGFYDDIIDEKTYEMKSKVCFYDNETERFEE